MSSFLNWLLGIKAAPDWVSGDDTQWHLDMQARPEGLWAVAAVAAGVVAVAGIWYLYRLEGRSLSWFARVVLSGLRLAIVVCMAFMLLELVVEFTKSELVPSHLLVLMDTSESMSLADPYSDASTAREAAQRLDLMAADGEPDAARAVLYAGQTQLLTPGGVLPLSFDIEANSLSEAAARFPEAVHAALEQAIEEAREYRREASSRIVVPDIGGGGALPSGGKIKL